MEEFLNEKKKQFKDCDYNEKELLYAQPNQVLVNDKWHDMPPIGWSHYAIYRTKPTPELDEKKKIRKKIKKLEKKINKLRKSL